MDEAALEISLCDILFLLYYLSAMWIFLLESPFSKFGPRHTVVICSEDQCSSKMGFCSWIMYGPTGGDDLITGDHRSCQGVA